MQSLMKCLEKHSLDLTFQNKLYTKLIIKKRPMGAFFMQKTLDFAK